MKKTKETANPNPTGKKWPKFSNTADAKSQFGILGFGDNPDYRSYLMDLCELYVQDKNVTSLRYFIFDQNIPTQSFYTMLSKDKEMHERWRECQLKVAENRRELGTWRKIDKDLALRWLHTLDEDEKKVDKYWADLKKDEDKLGGDKVIYIEVPKTVVEEKKEGEEK